MEVIVLRGKIEKIRHLANSLLSLRGVKHRELFVTVPGHRITAGDMPHSHLADHTH